MQITKQKENGKVVPSSLKKYKNVNLTKGKKDICMLERSIFYIKEQRAFEVFKTFICSFVKMII